MQITLKAARVRDSLTLADVAKKLEIHPQTLSKFEANNSKIRWDLIQKVSQHYMLNPDDIFLVAATKKNV